MPKPTKEAIDAFTAVLTKQVTTDMKKTIAMEAALALKSLDACQNCDEAFKTFIMLACRIIAIGVVNAKTNFDSDIEDSYFLPAIKDLKRELIEQSAAKKTKKQ